MRFAAICVCAASLLLLLGARADNDDSLFGWHDFHLELKDDNQAEVIRSFAEEKDLIIARENHHARPEDVLVAPELVDSFKQLLNQLSVKFDIPETDMGSVLLKEQMDNAEQEFSFNSDPTTFFARPAQINSWIQGLARANSDIASIQNIGRSYEGRDMLVLKLSTNPSANKPIMFLDSAIHAREWLAPATVNYLIKRFVTNKNSNEIRQLMDKYDWYFLPVVNPDGYEYTFSSSRTRFWRKTRKPYGQYYGADPNRNFDFQFGGPSTSNNPRSDIYHGPRPFSEPETANLSNFLRTIRSRIVRGAYISFHTYGQLWLTPPGYTRRNPPDHAEMMRVGNAANAAIRATNGISFRVGQPANVGLYEAAGGSYDWVKFVLGVKYSYTPELRPRWPAGINGFLAKPSDIPVSGREIFAAMQAIARALP